MTRLMLHSSTATYTTSVCIRNWRALSAVGNKKGEGGGDTHNSHATYLEHGESMYSPFPVRWTPGGGSGARRWIVEGN